MQIDFNFIYIMFNKIKASVSQSGGMTHFYCVTFCADKR